MEEKSLPDFRNYEPENDSKYSDIQNHISSLIERTLKSKSEDEIFFAQHQENRISRQTSINSKSKEVILNPDYITGSPFQKKAEVLSKDKNINKVTKKTEKNSKSSNINRKIKDSINTKKQKQILSKPSNSLKSNKEPLIKKISNNKSNLSSNSKPETERPKSSQKKVFKPKNLESRYNSELETTKAPKKVSKKNSSSKFSELKEFYNKWKFRTLSMPYNENFTLSLEDFVEFLTKTKESVDNMKMAIKAQEKNLIQYINVITLNSLKYLRNLIKPHPMNIKILAVILTIHCEEFDCVGEFDVEVLLLLEIEEPRQVYEKICDPSILRNIPLEKIWWAKTLLSSFGEEENSMISQMFSDIIPKLYNYAKIAIEIAELEWKLKLKSEPIYEDQPENPPQKEVITTIQSSSEKSNVKAKAKIIDRVKKIQRIQEKEKKSSCDYSNRLKKAASKKIPKLDKIMSLKVIKPKAQSIVKEMIHNKSFNISTFSANKNSESKLNRTSLSLKKRSPYKDPIRRKLSDQMTSKEEFEEMRRIKRIKELEEKAVLIDRILQNEQDSKWKSIESKVS